MVNCETCDNWFHCACVGISRGEFARFVRDESARFECAACAARQATERRIVDQDGTVWDAAWDRAGRQYYVDRATGRTSRRVSQAAAGSPGYYKARARARVVEIFGDQLFSLPPRASRAARLVATVTPPGDDEEQAIEPEPPYINRKCAGSRSMAMWPM